MSSYSSKRARALMGSAASTMVLAALLSAGAISPAFAQDQKPAAAADKADEGVEVEKVVITGTFLRGTSETAAIPVEGVNLEELRDKGSPSNMDLIKGLSEIGSVAGEANRNNGFALGAQSVNLRSLSSSRTVVVFNGRRFPEQYSFTVGRFNNIAQIPNAAIGRVEVLKDGGATTYGADAIGGVVNYITRRNVNGVEVNASYTAIKDSDGDYDASILAGKTFENFNIMGVLGYIHRNELALPDRDWALRDYLINPASWNGAGNPGAYAFQTSTASASGNVITPFGTGTNKYLGNLQMSVTGVMRDPACSALGGFAGWSATPSPVCYQQTGWRQKLVDETTTWQGYAEANYEFSPKFKVHGEFAYYNLDIPHVAIDNGGGLVNNFPLLRDSTGALITTTTGCPVGTSSCAQTQSYGTSATPAYYVPGSNPAVAPFLNTFKNSDGTNAFTAAQIAAITTGGRIALPSGTWRPFGAGGNPEYDFQHNYSTQYRYTLEFSGDLGKFAGGAWDWSAAYTLNTLDYTLAFYDIPVDRLQASLNGLGGNNCGPGAAPGSTGCLWFNPFSSAVKENVYTHAQNTVTYNAAATNSKELIDWLYVPQSMLRRSNYAIFDVLLRGELDYHLWSDEKISLAVGAQYRELNETSDLTDLGDEFHNPCATVGVQACTTRQGTLVFRRDANVSGFVRDYDRQYPVEAAFGEIRLPITDTFNVQLSSRWEKFFSDLGAKDNQVVVSQAAARWQATPWLAFRGTAGQTFSNANPPAPSAPNTNAGVALTSEYCAATGCGGVQYTTANYSNTAVSPEKGFNWNVGAIVQAGDFRVTLDYYNIEIDSVLVALSAANTLRAATVGGPAGAATFFNCSSPLLTEKNALMENRAFVELKGACVQGTSTVQNDLARVNFFGSQGQQTQLYNGPGITTSGLDFNAKWSHGDIFGGDLTIEGDASYVLTYDVGAFQIAGFTINPAYDAVGKVNNGGGRLVAQRINPWRGSVTFNYKHGRHNFNWSTRFLSSILNTDDTLMTPSSAFNANIAAGANPALLCNGQLVSAPVPTGAGTGLYGTNTGAIGPVGFSSCQNVSVINGMKIPATMYSDFTYRIALPAQTNLSFTVNNVFDTDPAFSRDIINYDAYSGSPLGRTFKVSVSKKF